MQATLWLTVLSSLVMKNLTGSALSLLWSGNESMVILNLTFNFDDPSLLRPIVLPLSIQTTFTLVFAFGPIIIQSVN